MAIDVSKLTDEELDAAIASRRAETSISTMSDADLDKAIALKKAEASGGGLKDHYVGATKGVLFGTRPFVAGVGGAIGSGLERLSDPNLSMSEKLKALPGAMGSGFSGARRDAIAEENELSDRRGGLSAAYDVGGAVLTAPLFALKGLQAANAASKGASILRGAGTASKIGAGLGAAHALGHAESVGEAVGDVATGAGLGALTQVGANAVAKAAPVVLNKLGKGVDKLRSLRTGIAEKDIQTFQRRADEVNDLFTKSGENITEAADTIRKKLSSDIVKAREKLSSGIKMFLSEAPKDKTVDVSPFLAKLEASKARLNPVLHPQEMGEINELIKRVRDLAPSHVFDPATAAMKKSGKVSIQELNDLKEFFQNRAKAAYMKDGQIFQSGKASQQAAKGVAAEIRKVFNKLAPDAAEANNKLSLLHSIEEKINKNLITAEKPVSALLAAGSGKNQLNAKMLGKIDSLIGTDSVRQAENLSAAASFGKPRWMPQSSEGTTSTSRTIVGGAVGSILGGYPGAAAGFAATSPAALKLEIQTANMMKRVLSTPAKAIGNAIAGPTARSALISERAQSGLENTAASGAIARRMERLRGMNKKKPSINE